MQTWPPNSQPALCSSATGLRHAADGTGSPHGVSNSLLAAEMLCSHEGSLLFGKLSLLVWLSPLSQVPQRQQLLENCPWLYPADLGFCSVVTL